MTHIQFFRICVVLVCAVASAARTAGAKGKNVYAYFAAKFPILDKDAVNSKSLLGNGPVISSGYLIDSSYPNTGMCNNEPNVISFLTLGACGIYHADYTDPHAVPQSCGMYVKPTAYRSDFGGENNLDLTYTFYTDATCTTAGVGNECTQTIGIASDCYSDTIFNATTSSNATFSETLDLPADGYFGL